MLISIVLVLFGQCILASPGPWIPDSITTYVDIVELNHVHDQQWQPRFDVYIFWRWNRVKERFDVVAWRWVRDNGQQVLPPCRYDHQRKLHGLIWREKGVIRIVYGHSYRETWWNVDRELHERSTLPAAARQGL